MGGEEGVILPPLPPPPIWFSLNNSKTVKAVIGDIRAQFGIHNLPQSSDIGQTSDRGISDFRISAQSLMKENCHSSRTSDEIDMKLGEVTKLDKRNKTTSKKFDDDVMSKNCEVIAILRIFDQFGEVRRPEFGHRVCKSYVFSNMSLYSYKSCKQN